jgi:hypothetical protein
LDKHKLLHKLAHNCRFCIDHECVIRVTRVGLRGGYAYVIMLAYRSTCTVESSCHMILKDGIIYHPTSRLYSSLHECTCTNYIVRLIQFLNPLWCTHIFIFSVYGRFTFQSCGASKLTTVHYMHAMSDTRNKNLR